MLNKDKIINETQLFYRFNAEDGLMYTRPQPWNDPSEIYNGPSDALWRTGIAYATYGDHDLRDGILGCYRKFDMLGIKDKYWYQSARCSNRFREDDVSRDQNIMALASLAFNGDQAILKELIDHLPFRLSRKFRMTPTMWFWLRWLSTRKPIWDHLYQLFHTLEHAVEISFTKLIRTIAGLNKHIDVYDPGPCPIDTDSFLIRNYIKLRYPGYALYLSAWMYYTSRRKGLFARMNRALMLWEAEKDNLLIKALMGKTVTDEEIDAYRPMSWWRWSCRLDGTHWIYYPPIGEFEYNNMQVDIVRRVRDANS